jgi:hypothetical protein
MVELLIEAKLTGTNVAITAYSCVSSCKSRLSDLLNRRTTVPKDFTDDGYTSVEPEKEGLICELKV